MGIGTIFRLISLIIGSAFPVGTAEPIPTGLALQPVQEYFTPFGSDTPFEDHGVYGTQFTHLGTDYGIMGPAAGRVRWAAGGSARVDLREGGNWAGIWHSLAGAAADRAATLDFTRCYPPWIQTSFQPRCEGVFVRASGNGRLTIEIKGPDDRVAWSQFIDLARTPREYRFAIDPSSIRSAKYLNWMAGPGTQLDLDAVGLLIRFPPLSLPDRTFLIAYAKLARSAVPGTGLVKDQAQRPAGAFEGIPASGLYVLATAAAADRGVVDRSTAITVLSETLRAFADLPRADGWLPHFVTRGPDGRYVLPRGTEFSTVDTSIAYHSLLLAAGMLNQTGAEADILARIRRIRFDRVRGPDGFIRFGLAGDGKTPLSGGWTEWGGEAALVLLLERIALETSAAPKKNRTGKVPNGVGFVAELQSLFYPQFDRVRPDALSGVVWLDVRRELAGAQAAAVAREPRASAAARLGLFGQSAGEGFRGRGYLADGLRTPPTILHPHYLLMAGLSAADPAPVWDRVRAMESAGLMPPWGLVENVTSDLVEYLPVNGSLNAAFECLSAYRVGARTGNRPDRIAEAARSSKEMERAIQLFYPELFDGTHSIPGAGGKTSRLAGAITFRRIVGGRISWPRAVRPLPPPSAIA